MSASDNLANNLNKVQYNTFFSTHKIVQSYVGSFRYGTDTVTRNYTLSGLPNPQQAFRIEHGYTRPLMVELEWSTDGSSYYVGNGADNGVAYGIAYSDSTYIYVMPSQLAAGTVFYYKLVCTWIDDYDTTNPTIGEFDDLPAAYTQTFNSRSRIPSIVRQGVLSGSTPSPTLASVQIPYTHLLGYSPEMKVYIEAFSGEVWPMNAGGAANPYLVDDNQVEGVAFTDVSQLTVFLNMKSVNGTRRAWFSLYGKQADPISGRYNVVQSAI